MIGDDRRFLLHAHRKRQRGLREISVFADRHGSLHFTERNAFKSVFSAGRKRYGSHGPFDLFQDPGAVRGKPDHCGAVLFLRGHFCENVGFERFLYGNVYDSGEILQIRGLELDLHAGDVKIEILVEQIDLHAVALCPRSHVIALHHHLAELAVGHLRLDIIFHIYGIRLAAVLMADADIERIIQRGLLLEPLHCFFIELFGILACRQPRTVLNVQRVLLLHTAGCCRQQNKNGYHYGRKSP